MTYNLESLGNQIRKHRILQTRTLQEVADEAGFSKSLISKIENGKVHPPIATLIKIAAVLRVQISALVGENESVDVVHDDKIEEHLTKTKTGYSIAPFATNYPDKKMQPIIIEAKKGEVKKHNLVHEGEEFIYVVDGELSIKVGTTTYVLKKGDGIYFNAVLPHGIKPITDKVKYLNMFI
jgi:transcriptional regulator with XRE-family HTH domain